MKNRKEEAPMTLRTANECLAEVGAEAEMLFDEFWRDGEVALMFGAAGTGKTILGMQVANALACGGGGIAGLRMPQRRRKVLYVDMEMSDAQFRARYMFKRKNGIAEGYHFAKNLFIWRPSATDDIAEKLAEAVEKNGIRAVVIDALANGARARELMGALKRLKNERGIASLVLVESAEPRAGSIASEVNVRRGRDLTRFADSVFGVARHPGLAKHYYLMQTRSRHPLVWTERNAPVCTVVKKEKGALHFEFDERFRPKTDEATLILIRGVKAMIDGGMTYRAIADELGMSLGRVQRLYKRWTPAVGDNGELRTGNGQVVNSEQVTANSEKCAVDPDQESEAEEWDEAGFERPEWIDIEQETGKEDAEKGRRSEEETGDGERGDEASSAEDEDVSQRPATVPQGRSVYELKRTVNADGYEIWVEQFDKLLPLVPRVWYRIDRNGNMTRWERGKYSSTSTPMGPAR